MPKKKQTRSKSIVKKAGQKAKSKVTAAALSVHNKLKKAGLRLPHGYVVVKRKNA